MYTFDPAVSSAVEGKVPPAMSAPPPEVLAPDVLDKMHRYWQATNYVTIGQIYLRDNPLLRRTLSVDDIKPRLLGHWGTSPGLSLLYVHLNRLIVEHDIDMIYLAGPGHGGPAIVANVYLEGTYSEIYPRITRDENGLRELFRQFSTPGGIPSHVSVTTPGSIHEGGELGYVLSHAFGAVFDNPDLIVAAVVGDGEAETAPLEGAWKCTAFLNPIRDGAVLPILHLNGYKIGGPTVLGRSTDEDIASFLAGHGYRAIFVEGDEPARVHQALAGALETAYASIREIQHTARDSGEAHVSGWPAIVLRTPKGWTGPKVVDGLPVEGTFRAHQVPLINVRADPAQLSALDEWMRSYGPDEHFDESGRLDPDLAALAPKGDRRMGANPHANGGKVMAELRVPDFRQYALDVPRAGASSGESTRRLGMLLADVFVANRDAANFRLFCPDETQSNRLGNVFDVENRCFTRRPISIDDHVSPDGRVMEVLSEHLHEGWLEAYNLTGRHGLFATYEAFSMVAASMMVQHSKWLEEASRLDWRAPVPSLNVLLTSTCWRNDHNGFSHQGPGLIDVMLSKRGNVTRIYLPPDANCLLSVADHCLRSQGYVNLMVIDKQPQLQYLSMNDAIRHCTEGSSVWEWASNDEGFEPDVVLAAAGDIPTLETLAAAEWLMQNVPELKLRVVNVVDLMSLFPPSVHPHGMPADRFERLFTADRPVTFAFHGYQRAVHEIVHGRPNPDRFHVRGFNEQGTTTTPFDMVVLNGMSRYHLARLSLEFATRLSPQAPRLMAECDRLIAEAVEYSRRHLQDDPKISGWTWGRFAAAGSPSSVPDPMHHP